MGQKKAGQKTHPETGDGELQGVSLMNTKRRRTGKQPERVQVPIKVCSPPPVIAGDEEPKGHPAPPETPNPVEPTVADRLLAALAKAHQGGLLSKYGIEEMLETDDAREALTDCGIGADVVDRVLQGMDEDEQLSISDLSIRLHRGQNAAPQIAHLKHATEEDRLYFPIVLAAFIKYCTSNYRTINDRSIRSYAIALRKLFSQDWKTPEAMASADYLSFINGSFDNARNHGASAACLVKFAKFWGACGKESLAELAGGESFREAPVWQGRSSVGDGSQEARDQLQLPDGWKVVRENNLSEHQPDLVMGCFSPRGTFYRCKGQTLSKSMKERLGKLTPPKRPAPNRQLKLLAAATPKDLRILPQVAKAFGDYLATDKPEMNEISRRCMVRTWTSLFEQHQLDFPSMASDIFVDASHTLEGNKLHGTVAAAFADFWKVQGSRTNFKEAQTVMQLLKQGPPGGSSVYQMDILSESDVEPEDTCNEAS